MAPIEASDDVAIQFGFRHMLHHRASPRPYRGRFLDTSSARKKILLFGNQNRSRAGTVTDWLVASQLEELG
jgi:hypothetical protein